MGILVKLVKRHHEKNECKPKSYWCEVYKVHGINPETGRKRTIQVVEASNAQAEIIQSKSGLLPPFRIEKATRPASDLQLETLRKHGFRAPSDLSMEDASVFITRSVEGEPFRQPTAPLSFVKYAIKHNVYIPKYANVKEAKDYLKTALPANKKEIGELR